MGTRRREGLRRVRWKNRSRRRKERQRKRELERDRKREDGREGIGERGCRKSKKEG